MRAAKGKLSEADEALRRRCLAAERGDRSTPRVFVDRGTRAFAAWARIYRRLGLVGPLPVERMVFDAATKTSSPRVGAYFPREAAT